MIIIYLFRGHTGQPPLYMIIIDLIFLKVEYLSLSRDTTETDIKQRRELVSGNAIYKDAAAVRAAMNGRVLILDGVERVERNVLPGLGLENFRVLKRF